MKWLAFIFPAVLFLGSCNKDDWSQVTIYITADPTIRATTKSLRLTIIGINGTTRKTIQDRDTTRPITPDEWPFRIGLAPTGDPRTSRYRAVVEAVDGDDATLLKVSATSGYIPNASKALVLHLRDECTNTWRDCENQAGDQTCKVLNSIARCVDDTVEPDSLPDLPKDNTVIPSDPDASIATDVGHDSPTNDVTDAGTDGGNPNGSTCTNGSDCASAYCAPDSVCRPQSCTDGTMSGDESDADCGGSCQGCTIGQNCFAADDCLTDECIDGFCAPRKPICSDGLTNGDETGTDCGGTCPRGCVVFDCSQQSDIPLSECEKLVDLYNSMNGATWTTLTDWFTAPTPCSWTGVQCTSSPSNINALFLREDNLEGVIPRGMDTLTKLQQLTISHTTNGLSYNQRHHETSWHNPSRTWVAPTPESDH